MLSGRGLCDELITRPEESYRPCCVVVCDLETLRIGAPYIYDISNLRVKSLDLSKVCLQIRMAKSSRQYAEFQFENKVQGQHKVFPRLHTFITRRHVGTLRCTSEEFQPWIIFQQDGAPPHWGSHVPRFLDATFPNRWTGRDGPTPWPPQ